MTGTDFSTKYVKCVKNLTLFFCILTKFVFGSSIPPTYQMLKLFFFPWMCLSSRDIYVIASLCDLFVLEFPVTPVSAVQSVVPFGPCSLIHAISYWDISYSHLRGHQVQRIFLLLPHQAWERGYYSITSMLLPGKGPSYTSLWSHFPWYLICGFITSLGLWSKERNKYPNLFSISPNTSMFSPTLKF